MKKVASLLLTAALLTMLFAVGAMSASAEATSLLPASKDSSYTEIGTGSSELSGNVLKITATEGIYRVTVEYASAMALDLGADDKLYVDVNTTGSFKFATKWEVAGDTPWANSDNENWLANNDWGKAVVARADGSDVDMLPAGNYSVALSLSAANEQLSTSAGLKTVTILLEATGGETTMDIAFAQGGHIALGSGSGDQQESPAGDEQETPAGDQQDTPADTPAGDQQETPAGDQQETPAGDQQETPAGDQQNTPAGGATEGGDTATTAAPGVTTTVPAATTPTEVSNAKTGEDITTVFVMLAVMLVAGAAVAATVFGKKAASK